MPVIEALMESLNESRLRELLDRAHIDAAEPAAGIGYELRYRRHAPRLIVIHLAETDSPEYCIDVVDRILEADDKWVLITRYGSIGGLGFTPAAEDVKAISFSAAERHALATYLCSRSTDLASISADLYVFGDKGEILVTWDHHSADEGIDVSLQSVGDAGRLLVSLNDLGVELEVFYT